ncbi:MAG: hypothetical protein J6N93_08590 [Clostridia bacterium]|nr:hypothetical protein [Clostridia bacterium]
MKKTFIRIATVALAGIFALGAAACGKTVKDGSVIENCTIKVSYVKDGKTVERDIAVELYDNFAPATIEHFKYLAEKGYFDGAALSNTNGYVEFGAYEQSGNKLVSRADKYAAIIDAAYKNGKTVGTNGLMRYMDDGSIRGEFAANGIGGNRLSFSDGVLVLKRDYSADKNSSYYNTGKGSMAFVFASSTYFDSSEKFAILGKLVSTDAAESNGNVSSFSFASGIRTDYAKDADGRTYYYYTYEYDPEKALEADREDEEKAKASLEELGSRYFMLDEDGDYFALNEQTGAYTVAVDKEEHDVLLKHFNSKSVYLLRTVAQEYNFKVVSVTIG